MSILMFFLDQHHVGRVLFTLFRRFVLVFIHVAEYLFHGGVADGPVEVDELDARGRNISEQGQKQQKSTETG